MRLACHGRGRGFESRRHRHSLQKSCTNFDETNEGAKGCIFAPLLHPFSSIRAVFNVERWTSHNHAVGFEHPLQSVYLFGGVAFLNRLLARR